MLKTEVASLRRSTRREGVNLEYLKNIVVQYMSLNDATQKQTLERVLATLLQFSPSETKEITDSRSIYAQYFSPTKQMKPPVAPLTSPGPSMMPLAP